ncbi:MAG: Rne/Rng family ribonuclease [Acetobacteraceae bacterium]|nr:Rne/Rng family ribonuclease [Acetobacteraceae bacterium]
MAADPEPADREPSPPAAQPLAIEYPTRHAAHEPDSADTALIAESDDPSPAERVGDGPATAGEAAADALDHDEEPHAEPAADLPPPETVGGDADAVEETRTRRPPPRFLRNYKIQEVIRRRQILLVQVVKEERGTKGAALTTYLSLAGRYCVLMPNSPRGGGISRKITSAADRRRLKEITSEMDLPPGMGLIVRTAGANRPKPEIKRDCEYLMRLWDEIREHTLRSVAPALIYEEASLIKRAIRDVYSRDVDELVVDGEDGWKAARDFMRTLMPTHAKKVQLWEDGGMPLFARHGVEAQLDSMMMPTVQLRSGGYLVINQTEALVAIDVNSGRSTRERNIEETALRTNLEASDEIARQLRLRDLAGLIVIDYIDMESRKHNGMVEKRLKDALKNDRARIQVGHISHFGLLEMSRQRLRPSLAETSFVMCAQCGGTGHVRSIESAALHVLRHIEEEGAKRRAAEIAVHVAGPVAMYILNRKRELLRGIELRYAMQVVFQADSTMIAPQMRLERLRVQTADEAPSPVSGAALPQAAPEPEARERADEPEEDEEVAAPEAAEATTGEEEAGEEQRRRKRRRRRRGRRDETSPEALPGLAAAPADGEAAATGTEADPSEAGGEVAPEPVDDASAEADDHGDRNRRRGRRGGRRRRRGGDNEISPVAELGAEQPDVSGAPYQGPTPANPFATPAYDIFDVVERAGQAGPGPAGQSEPTPAPGLPAGLQAGSGPVVASEPPADASAPEVERDRETSETPEVEEAPTEAAAASDTQSNGPEVHGEPVVAAAVPPAPEPEAVAPSEQEPVRSAPPIQPILVGASDAPDAPKKRGWWRR